MAQEIIPCSKVVRNVLGGKGSDTGEAGKISRGQAHTLKEMRTDVGKGVWSCSAYWQGTPRGFT